jgi:hypothetical protein
MAAFISEEKSEPMEGFARGILLGTPGIVSQQAGSFDPAWSS